VIETLAGQWFLDHYSFPTHYTREDSLVTIGTIVHVKVEDFVLPMQVVDTRTVWGRDDILIAPVAGNGQQWVSADRVRVPA